MLPHSSDLAVSIRAKGSTVAPSMPYRWRYHFFGSRNKQLQKKLGAIIQNGLHYSVYWSKEGFKNVAK